MNKKMIVVGNVIDGFQHFGPFDTTDQALATAEEEFSGMIWVICDIIKLIPNDEEGPVWHDKRDF